MKMSTADCSSPSRNASDPADAMDCGVAEDEYLVQVRAQVMTRDDSSGGWLPTSGGGMSVVGVQAGAQPPSNHYKIRGRRVCDQAMVLDCAVTDDLLYVKATPTFHHWRTRGKRFGLTFHSSADAQVFETCIQRAARQLQDDKPLTGKQDDCDDDDSVMKLQAPIDEKEASSLPASRTRTPSPCATMRVRCTVPGTAAPHSSFVSPASYYPFSCPHLDFVGSRSLYERRDQLRRNAAAEDHLTAQSASGGEPASGDGGAPSRSDGYVRFSRTDATAAETTASVGSVTPKSNSRLDVIPSPPASSHDYDYPVLVSSSSAAARGRCRDGSGPTVPVMQPVSLPRRKQRKAKGKSGGRRSASTSSARARCVYCQELYYVADNRCGSCADGPDDCATCIEHATCLCAARALLYHCATDDDGSYGTVCGAPPDSSPPGGATAHRRQQRRKWAIVAVLSVVLPCLWCYPALTACHRCAARRGHCGARHKAG